LTEEARWRGNYGGRGPPPAASEARDPVEVTTNAFATIERVWERGPRQYPSREDMAERRRKINLRMSEEWAAHLVEHGSRPGRDGGYEWKFDPLFNVGFGGPFTIEMLLAEYRMVQCPVLAITG